MKKMWTGVGLGVVCVAGVAVFSVPGRGQTTMPGFKGEGAMIESQAAQWELIKQRELALADLASDKARLAAVQNMTVKLQDQLEKEIAADETLGSYREAKALWEGRLKLLRDGPMGSPQEVSTTLAQVGGLQQAIADRLDMIRGRTHAGMYNELAKVNMLVSVDVAGAEARLAHVERRLGQLRGEK